MTLYLQPTCVKGIISHGRLVACHDGTPSIDLDCPGCGERNHLHESQIADVPAGADVGARCTSCRTPFAISRRLLERGFRIARENMEPTGDEAA